MLSYHNVSIPFASGLLLNWNRRMTPTSTASQSLLLQGYC